MSFAIRLPAEAEWLFSIGSVRNNRPGSTLLQPMFQFSTIVSLVAEQFFCRFPLLDQWFRGRAVVRRSISQHQREKAAFSISNCMDLRVASASRATDRLILLPPCILPLPADTKPERLPADGSPIPPR